MADGFSDQFCRKSAQLAVAKYIFYGALKTRAAPDGCGPGHFVCAGRNRPFLRDEGKMEKVPLTKPGYEKLNAELKELKEIQRPAVIKAIAEAREHGDLSENAEYHAARERQSFIEGRVQELEGIISRADVIDTGKMTGPMIKFGASVKLADEDTDEEKSYQIVGEAEADIDNGKLNLRSPLARALIGKEEGDSVEVKTPGGTRSYEVLSVEYM
jgi:transcription elongation factor GreA